VKQLQSHAQQNGIGPGDLLFPCPAPTESPYRRPERLPDPETLGLTDPNRKGRQYRHGTLTAYQAAPCRCRHCKDAVAAYRAARRASGKDDPRRPRQVHTDGHIPNTWFRAHIWNPAVDAAGIEFRVTPHCLRHAHASWLLAGGADLQVVKDRLGHGSIATTGKYLHALPGADQAALEALDAFRARPASATTTDPTPRDDELDEMRTLVARLSTMLEAKEATIGPMRG
jgi:hypothetical protein